MFIRARSEKRGVHLGPFPLETLPRDPSIRAREAARPPQSSPAGRAAAGPLATTLLKYRDIFAKLVAGKPAPAKAPLPDDPELWAREIKAFGYFIDAAHVGVCEIPESAWIGADRPAGLTHAVVLMIEHGRLPEKDNRAHDWRRRSRRANAQRAARPKPAHYEAATPVGAGAGKRAEMSI